MPNPIERMERKKRRSKELDRHLSIERHARESSHHAAGLEQVPAQEWRDEVAEAEDVEGAAEHGARYAVPAGQYPGDLRFVYA